MMWSNTIVTFFTLFLLRRFGHFLCGCQWCRKGYLVGRLSFSSVVKRHHAWSAQQNFFKTTPTNLWKTWLWLCSLLQKKTKSTAGDHVRDDPTVQVQRKEDKEYVAHKKTSTGTYRVLVAASEKLWLASFSTRLGLPVKFIASWGLFSWEMERCYKYPPTPLSEHEVMCATHGPFSRD